MNKNSLIILILALVIFTGGCLKKKEIKGKEYIPKEVLVNVLVDIHLIDGIVEDRRYYRKYNFNDSIDMMTPIFDKYNITRVMFDSTMAEYSRYPELLDQVYDEVIMELNVMLDEINKEEEEARVKEEEHVPDERSEKPEIPDEVRGRRETQ